MRDFLGGSSGKEPASQCRRCRRHRFNPRVEKIPWRRKWQPTPISLPWESHGQRRAVLTKSWTQLKWLSLHVCSQGWGSWLYCISTPPTCLGAVLSLYVQLWKIFSASLQIILVDSCFVNTCSFGVPVGGSESESVNQSCATLCDLMDCSLPDSSVHWIQQARMLEWVATSFSRGSPGPRNQTWVSCLAGGFFTIWVTRESHLWEEMNLKSFFSVIFTSPTLVLINVTNTKIHNLVQKF